MEIGSLFDRFSCFDRAVAILALLYGIAAFCVYLVAVRKELGRVKSISCTYYKWRQCWIFQAFMYYSSVNVILIHQTWWYVIAALCGIIMAMFPSITYKNFIIPHSVFATSFIFMCLLGLPLCYGTHSVVYWGICVLSALVVVLLVLAKKYKAIKFKSGYIYWIEVYTLLLFMIGSAISVL